MSDELLALPKPMSVPKNRKKRVKGPSKFGKPQGQFIPIPPNARFIRGYGKYVEPQAVFQSGSKNNTSREQHQRNKKNHYKKIANESNPWWKSITDTLPGLLTTAAPLVLKALTGFGDYTVNTNSILASATGGENGSQLPMMQNTKVSNVIRHREFIMNIFGSTDDFSLVTLPINPGLDSTFPWLFAIANSFTSYRMLGLVLEFKSLFSDYATTGYLGYVAIATQYNSLDKTFPDKQSLENSEYANSTKPSKNLLHPIECASDQQVLTHLYLRSGDIPNSSDLKFYDLGKTTIAVGGQQTAGIIGELWATYEVELYQPKLTRSSGLLINWDHWTGNGNGDGTHPLGFDPVQSSGSTMVGSSILTSTTYVFPSDITAGLFRWVLILQGTAVTITNPSIVYTKCAGQGFYKLSSARSSIGIPQDTTTSQNFWIMTGFVEVLFPGATFAIGVDGTLPTSADVDFTISQIPTSISDLQKRLRKQGYVDVLNKVEVLERTIEKTKKQLKTLKPKPSKEELSALLSKLELTNTSIDAILFFCSDDKKAVEYYCQGLQSIFNLGFPSTIIDELNQKFPTFSHEYIAMELSWYEFDVLALQRHLFKKSCKTLATSGKTLFAV